MRVFTRLVARFGIRSQPRSWVTSMMRKLEIGVSRNMNLSGIVTMILGAMYVGAMAMVVFLIMVQLQSRKRMPRTFASLLRVKLGVLGLSWDFWAKSVSELQLEVEQIQLDSYKYSLPQYYRKLQNIITRLLSVTPGSLVNRTLP